MITMRSGTLQSHPRVGVRHVPAQRVAEWLRRGWDDMGHFAGASLAHGVLIALLGAVLLILGRSHPYFIVAAVSGFLLIGPIMTTGACELSRLRAAGLRGGFDESLEALRRNPGALFRFGALLAGITLVWFMASEVMLRSILDVAWPSLDEVVWGGAMAADNRAQLLAYIGSGAVLAAIVFAVSVISVPLIIDRRVSATTAVWASINATVTNLPAMLLWAAIIVALTAVGFLTALVGMIVVAPLLGHASWHAYRDLVAEGE